MFEQVDQHHRHPSRRSTVYAGQMVSTSQPLAAQSGLEMLRQGGNAVDAAVATASTFSIKNLVRGSNVTAEDGREGKVIIFALTTFASRVIRPTEATPKRVPRKGTPFTNNSKRCSVQTYRDRRNVALFARNSAATRAMDAATGESSVR